MVKLAYIWAFSNDGCRISGMYLMDEAVAQLQTGMTRRQWKSAWERLLAYKKKGGSNLVKYDPDTGVVWVVGRFKQETATAPGVAPSRATIAGGLRELHELPNSVLHEAFRRKYGTYCRPPLGPPGGVSPPSTSTSPKPAPKGRDLKKRGSTNRRRSAAASKPDGLSQEGTGNPDGIDTSPNGIREAYAVAKGLEAMTTNRHALKVIHELRPIGVYEESRSALFEHPKPPRAKGELAREFPNDLVEGIYIRSPR
jgi:hypothetical protein